MSWREVLGAVAVTEDALTHNTENSQKAPASGISADIADSADKDSKLLETLASACRDLRITPSEVLDALAPEDVEDWHQGAITPDTLAAFARCLMQRRDMERPRS
jgi:hypothetical protein